MMHLDCERVGILTTNACLQDSSFQYALFGLGLVRINHVLRYTSLYLDWILIGADTGVDGKTFPVFPSHLLIP